MLRASGIDVGPIDGIVGSRTQRALAEFDAQVSALASAYAPLPEASERRVRLLQLPMQKAARDLVALLRQRMPALQGRMDVIIAAGFRSPEEQEQLYAKGRTAPGPVVTNARPWSSWHNFGRAIDIAFISDRTYIADTGPYRDAGRVVGEASDTDLPRLLRWGGTFSRLKDYPHYELRSPLSVAEYRKAFFTR